MRNLVKKPHTRTRAGNSVHPRRQRTEIGPKGHVSFSNIQESGIGFPEIARSIDKTYLIRLLYEGAIDYLAKARQAAMMGEAGAMAENIHRALNILHELSRSVKISKDDEWADQLGKLYLFWIKHVNRTKRLGDIRALDEVINMITTIRELCLVQPPKVRKMVRAI